MSEWPYLALKKAHLNHNLKFSENAKKVGIIFADLGSPHTSAVYLLPHDRLTSSLHRTLNTMYIIAKFTVLIYPICNYNGGHTNNVIKSYFHILMHISYV